MPTSFSNTTAARGRIRKSKKTLNLPEIEVFQNIDELSRRAAELFVDLANKAIGSRRTFSVSLAGGSTPKALYRLLSSPEYRGRINWSQVKFFFGDERNVPPTAANSNYRMAKESLFDSLDRDDLNVFRWPTEGGTPADVAGEYATVLGRELGSFPRFDLVLLGLGPDAHTASLFPHSPALNEKLKTATENWVEKLNDFRLTLTFPLFNNARNVVFLVAGEDKADAVKSVIKGGRDLQNYPAQGVDPTDGALIWLLDRAAAAKLETFF